LSLLLRIARGLQQSRERMAKGAAIPVRFGACESSDLGAGGHTIEPHTQPAAEVLQEKISIVLVADEHALRGKTRDQKQE